MIDMEQVNWQLERRLGMAVGKADAFDAGLMGNAYKDTMTLREMAFTISRFMGQRSEVCVEHSDVENMDYLRLISSGKTIGIYPRHEWSRLGFPEHVCHY